MTRSTITKTKNTVTKVVTSIECLNKSTNTAEQAVYRSFFGADEGIKPRDIAAKRGLHPKTVAAVIRRLKQSKLLYISGWKESANKRQLAVYKLGNHPDVPMPVKKRVAVALKAVDVLVLRHKALCEQYDAINRALVPVRNMKQQRVVNLRYLEHIQGIR